MVTRTTSAWSGSAVALLLAVNACSSAPESVEQSSAAIAIGVPVTKLPTGPAPAPAGTSISIPIGTPFPVLTDCGEAGQRVCSDTAFPACSLADGCNCDQVPLTPVNGSCVACGANQEIPCAPAPGYAGGCNEDFAVGSNGLCAACGMVGELACNECGGSTTAPPCPLPNGGCVSGTVNVNNVCVCGGFNQLACFFGPKCATCASGSCALGNNSDGSGVVVQPDGTYAGPCVECGLLGQPPCTNGAACTTNAVSNGSACVSCGASGQPACAGNACNGGLVDSNGKCVPCGASGQPACAGGACNSSGLVVSSGKCTPCGANNEIACAGGKCDAHTLYVAPSCVACGALEQPACAGGACNPPLVDKGGCYEPGSGGSSSGGGTSTCDVCYGVGDDGCTLQGMEFCTTDNLSSAATFFQEVAVCVPVGASLTDCTNASVQQYCEACGG